MIPLLSFSVQYLGELSLIDADPYLKYLPSVIAAAAFHLADYTITGQTWVCCMKTSAPSCAGLNAGAWAAGIAAPTCS